ncbi:MAG: ArsR family transcriptional regulator [Planctomycetes bacterium]|nr:ArsR family transcriptional regulator [Planctomycetota bacterium]
MITDRQAEILAYAREYWETLGYSPSEHEIAKHCGISQPAVCGHLVALEAAGVIKRPTARRPLVLITE